MSKEIEWNVDGHRMLLWLDKANLKVSAEICPHGATEDAPCYHAGIEGCAFAHFINMYGLEVNTGMVEAGHSMEMAWAMDGSQWEIDLVNFTVIPVSDPVFKDWYSHVSDSQAIK
tara:strand:+ start:529 stop:873 length:345 start_codon:yes stop_codon:yes gene_type:complete